MMKFQAWLYYWLKPENTINNSLISFESIVMQYCIYVLPTTLLTMDLNTTNTPNIAFPAKYFQIKSLRVEFIDRKELKE